jgi:hypothetical protein
LEILDLHFSGLELQDQLPVILSQQVSTVRIGLQELFSAAPMGAALDLLLMQANHECEVLLPNNKSAEVTEGVCQNNIGSRWPTLF